MSLLFRLIIMYLRSRLDSMPWPDLPETGPADGADVDPVGQVEVHHTEAVPIETGPEFDDAPKPDPEPAPAPEIIEMSEYKSRYCWCINHGHGALQPGKRSPIIPEIGERFYEYKWNRQITALIIEDLEYLGIEHVNVVPEVNVDAFLVERVARANNHATLRPKIYLSVHANAGPAPDLNTWSDAEGTETWYYHGSRLGRNAAAIFQRHLVKATGFRNRHLRSKVEGQFYELRKTNMVSVLTESGFYNNRREVMDLIDPEVMKRIAKAHVAAIIEIEEKGL